MSRRLPRVPRARRGAVAGATPVDEAAVPEPTIRGLERLVAGRDGRPVRVCFVCTGNICRSPMAALVFRTLVERAGLDDLVAVDSAGTGPWHVGEPADQRTVTVLRRHGYPTGHVARQFQEDWFADHELVVALDRGHVLQLRRLAVDVDHAAKVRMLRGFDPLLSGLPDTALDVPDPYFGSVEMFEDVLEMIEAAEAGLLRRLDALLPGDREFRTTD